MKIRNFTDLEAWKEGHKLVLEVLEISSALPRNNYALIDQMTRCSISITSNIAEGFSRQTKKEKVQFYYISKGSLTELQNQLLICKDTELITKEKFMSLAEQTVIIGKLITGLIRSASSR